MNTNVTQLCKILADIARGACGPEGERKTVIISRYRAVVAELDAGDEVGPLVFLYLLAYTHYYY